MLKDATWGPGTIAMVAVVLVVAVAGAVVTIVNPDTLGFERYITLMTGLGAALGIGRGLAVYTGSKAPAATPPPVDAAAVEKLEEALAALKRG